MLLYIGWRALVVEFVAHCAAAQRIAFAQADEVILEDLQVRNCTVYGSAREFLWQRKRPRLLIIGNQSLLQLRNTLLRKDEAPARRVRVPLIGCAATTL